MGHVQTIDLPNLTLQRRDKDPITMQVSKDAHVWKRGKQVGVDEIRIGDQSVACGSVTTGGFVAVRIDIYK